MPELTDWLEAKFEAAHELYKEYHDKTSFRQWEAYQARITEMEQRIMAAIDDLTAAVNADVAGRKALSVSVAEIGTAVTGVSTFLQNNPNPGTEVIANLAQQLSTAGADLTGAAGTLHSSALTLEALVPAPTVPDAAAGVSPAPPAVGDTVSIPVDPTDSTSPPADHTVTAVAADGSTITAQPVAGGDPVTVAASSVTPAAN